MFHLGSDPNRMAGFGGTAEPANRWLGTLLALLIAMETSKENLIETLANSHRQAFVSNATPACRYSSLENMLEAAAEASAAWARAQSSAPTRLPYLRNQQPASA